MTEYEDITCPYMGLHLYVCLFMLKGISYLPNELYRQKMSHGQFLN